LIFADTRRTDVLKNSKDYDKYIQAIPNSDAEKFRLTALTSRLGKTAAPSDILENFKKAYELCPHSSSIASEYGSELLLYRKLPEAERILIKLVKPDNSQSVLVDLNLAQIYYHLHKNSRADYFINIAMDKRNETTPSNRKEIERWKRKGQRIADAEYFIADCIHFLTSPFGIAMEILYFLLIILIIRKVMKSRSSK
jgi:hypothetical protein